MSKPVTLQIIENNDALVQVVCRNKDGSLFDLTGYNEFEFYVKATPDTVDDEPLYSTTGNQITVPFGPLGGTVNIQASAVDFSTSIPRWWHLDGIKDGKRLTLGYGLLKIVNV